MPVKVKEEVATIVSQNGGLFNYETGVMPTPIIPLPKGGYATVTAVQGVFFSPARVKYTGGKVYERSMTSLPMYERMRLFGEWLYLTASHFNNDYETSTYGERFLLYGDECVPYPPRHFYVGKCKHGSGSAIVGASMALETKKQPWPGKS